MRGRGRGGGRGVGGGGKECGGREGTVRGGGGGGKGRGRKRGLPQAAVRNHPGAPRRTRPLQAPGAARGCARIGAGRCNAPPQTARGRWKGAAPGGAVGRPEVAEHSPGDAPPPSSLRWFPRIGDLRCGLISPGSEPSARAAPGRPAGGAGGPGVTPGEPPARSAPGLRTHPDGGVPGPPPA